MHVLRSRTHESSSIAFRDHGSNTSNDVGAVWPRGGKAGATLPTRRFLRNRYSRPGKLAQTSAVFYARCTDESGESLGALRNPRRNDIDDEACKLLCPAIEIDSRNTRLDLGGNIIGDVRGVQGPRAANLGRPCRDEGTLCNLDGRLVKPARTAAVFYDRCKAESRESLGNAGRPGRRVGALRYFGKTGQEHPPWIQLEWLMLFLPWVCDMSDMLFLLTCSAHLCRPVWRPVRVSLRTQRPAMISSGHSLWYRGV